MQSEGFIYKISTGSTLNIGNYMLRLYLQRSFRSEQLATVRTNQSVHVSVYIPKIEHRKFQTFQILIVSVKIFFQFLSRRISQRKVKSYSPVVHLYHGLNNIGITKLADHHIRIALGVGIVFVCCWLIWSFGSHYFLRV